MTEIHMALLIAIFASILSVVTTPLFSMFEAAHCHSDVRWRTDAKLSARLLFPRREEKGLSFRPAIIAIVKALTGEMLYGVASAIKSRLYACAETPYLLQELSSCFTTHSYSLLLHWYPEPLASPASPAPPLVSPSSSSSDPWLCASLYSFSIGTGIPLRSAGMTLTTSHSPHLLLADSTYGADQ